MYWLVICDAAKIWQSIVSQSCPDRIDERAKFIMILVFGERIMTFIERPEQCSPISFPDLLRNEAEARGFIYDDEGCIKQFQWTGTVTATRCVLVFTIEKTDGVCRLSVESRNAKDTSFGMPPLTFVQNGKHWEWWFEQFRMDWLAWLFCEFADKGEIIIMNSHDLARNYIKKKNGRN